MQMQRSLPVFAAVLLLIGAAAPASAQTARSKVTFALTVSTTAIGDVPADEDEEPDSTIVKAKFTTKDAIAAVRAAINAEANDKIEIFTDRDLDGEVNPAIVSGLVVIVNDTVSEDADALAFEEPEIGEDFLTAAVAIKHNAAGDVASEKVVTNEAFSFSIGNLASGGAEVTGLGAVTGTAKRKKIVDGGAEDDVFGLLFGERNESVQGHMILTRPTVEGTFDGVLGGSIEAGPEQVVEEGEAS